MAQTLPALQAFVGWHALDACIRVSNTFLAHTHLIHHFPGLSTAYFLMAIRLNMQRSSNARILVELGHSILVAAGRLLKGYLQRLGRFELVLFSTVLRGYEPAYLAQGVCIP
eukprot:6184772-Pleurochrysis_carterae.AAC.2